MRTKKGQAAGDGGKSSSSSPPHPSSGGGTGGAATTTTASGGGAATNSLTRLAAALSTRRRFDSKSIKKKPSSSASAPVVAPSSTTTQKVLAKSNKKTLAVTSSKATITSSSEVKSSEKSSTVKVKSVKSDEVKKSVKKMVVSSSVANKAKQSGKKDTNTTTVSSSIVESSGAPATTTMTMSGGEKGDKNEKTIEKDDKKLDKSESSTGIGNKETKSKNQKPLKQSPSRAKSIKVTAEEEKAKKRVAEKSKQVQNSPKPLIVSKELKNLGINLKSYHENLKKSDDMMVLITSATDCKTSICESVKTKSRNQSIYSPSQFPIPVPNDQKSNNNSNSNKVATSQTKKQKQAKDEEQPEKSSSGKESKSDPEELIPSYSIKNNSEETVKSNNKKLNAKVVKNSPISAKVVEDKSKKKDILKVDKKSKEVLKGKIKIIPKKIQQKIGKSSESNLVKDTKKQIPEKGLKSSEKQTSEPNTEPVQDVGKITVKSLESLKNPEVKTEVKKEDSNKTDSSLKTSEAPRERKILFKRKNLKDEVSKKGKDQVLDKQAKQGNEKKEKTVYDFDSGNDDLAASPPSKNDEKLRKVSASIKMETSNKDSKKAPPSSSSEINSSSTSATKQSKLAMTKEPKKSLPPNKKVSEKNEENSGDHDSSGSESSESSNRSSVRRNKISKRNIIQKQLMGQKRHREASLNALAKVQCLYENESRSAHELGLFKTQMLKEMKKNSSGASSDEAKDSEDKSSNSKDDVPTRSLRNAPGLRAVGKHWEMNDISSSDEFSEDSDSGSDASVVKDKSSAEDRQKTVKPTKPKKPKYKSAIKASPDSKTKSKGHMKLSNPSSSPSARKVKQKRVEFENNSESSESVALSHSQSAATTTSSSAMSKNVKASDEIVPKEGTLLGRKRMASLNASAFMAATYEAEMTLDRNLSVTDDEDEEEEEDSSSEIEANERGDGPKANQEKESKQKETGKKKEKPDKKKSSPTKKIKNENDDKSSEPVSTSVMILQDTDVTITGVYVNSSVGANQEAYCKMQYRVQSSVTTHNSQSEPPKCYTPLGALSSMRPPVQEQGKMEHPSGHNIDQSDSNPLMKQPPQASYSSPIDYHHPHHSLHPGGGGGGPGPAYSMPPQTPYPQHPSLYHHNQHSAGSSSAFCTPVSNQSQHDLTGYYQPAGPLITHTNAGGGVAAAGQSPLKSSKSESSSTATHQVHQPLATPPSGSLESHQLDSDFHRSQSFRYIPQAAPGPYSRPIHQLHCTYPPPPPPPSYYPAYGQHPQEICYSPTYQPPYYPQKVYASAPSYRRFVGGSYYQGAPSPAELYDHQSSSRLLPPPPPGGAALDQYSNPYYSPYATSGSPCYSRGVQPYLDSPPPPSGSGGAGGTGGVVSGPPNPYQNSCPCPMQSCPKNVHTGPLIGSQVIGKGPGQVGAGVGASGGTNSTGSCKIEQQDQRLGEDSTYHLHHFHSNYPQSHKEQHYEKVAAAPNNYTLNTALEPEMSTSPARGSTGLPSTPISPPQMDSNNNASQMVRKARIGKNMVRERQMMMTSDPTMVYNSELAHHHHHFHHNLLYANQPGIYHHMKYPDRVEYDPSYHGYHHHHQHPGKGPPQETTDYLKANVKQELPEIKSEQIVKLEMISDDSDSSSSKQEEEEEEEEVLISVEDKRSKKCDKGVVEVSSRVTKQKATISSSDVCSELLSESVPAKNKPVSEVTVLEVDRVDKEEGREEQSRLSGTSETEQSSSNKGQEVVLKGKRMSLNCNRNKIVLSFDNKPKKSNYKKLIKPTEPKPYLCSTMAKDSKRRLLPKYRTHKGKIVKRRLVSRTSRHGRSMHFSVRRTKIYLYKKHKSKVRKPKSTNNSEEQNSEDQNKEETVQLEDFINNNNNKELNNNNILIDDEEEESCPKSNLETTIDLVARGYFTESIDEEPQTKRSKKESQPKSTKSSENIPITDPIPDPVESDSKVTVFSKEKNSQEATKRKEKTKKAKQPKRTVFPEGKKEKEEPILEAKEINTSLPETVPEPVKEPVITEEPKVTVEEKNLKEGEPVKIEEEKIKAPQLLSIKSVRRSKSRGSKYSTKKKHKQRLLRALEDVPITRKSQTQPRWSNGWNWLGESFQGHVFLNSDDPPMIRTCYPAMRHSEGDIVRPRDCVLLKAGSKRNELPYVAKVAHLWENPEDGEMMMSLLWYYRPEHTEQGRQDVDGLDEVFASRHKDHNSVACIEDKCYVLTFNEYCRYRKLLKSIEENVELPSIVPPLKTEQDGSGHSKVPPNTSPELVMFCHRVYEFRLKRMKNFY